MRKILLAGIFTLGLTVPALAVDTGAGALTLVDARIMIDAGNYGMAATTLRQIVAADDGNADALNLLGFALRKAGNVTEAEEFYLKALALEPEHVGANEYLGELYVETGDLVKANERLAVLQDACGSCEEAAELEALIASAE